MKKYCEFDLLGSKWKLNRVELVDGDELSGGMANLGEKSISILKRYDEPMFLQTVLHELFEACSFVVGTTFTRLFPEKQDLYILDHSQMNLIMENLFGSYEEIKRKMVGGQHVKKSSSHRIHNKKG